MLPDPIIGLPFRLRGETDRVESSSILDESRVHGGGRTSIVGGLRPGSEALRLGYEPANRFGRQLRQMDGREPWRRRELSAQALGALSGPRLRHGSRPSI